ncbi:MAG: ATP synthase F1 subunit gamma [Halobacteriovoraceae bacterium]|nr:ATP synthase F1 subunit gamma [Halobacteriovoraceae bacterium]
MANIKDLKKRIKSTKNTLKITSAMKLVSAAKLAKAQARIQGLKPYVREMENTVRAVSAIAEGYTHSFFKTTENPHNILLVISADKGLCGAYNSGLAKKVKEYLKANGAENFKLYFIGKKVRELLEKDYPVEKTFTFEKLEPTHQEIRNIANELAFQFRSGEIGKVLIAHNEFISAISFEPSISQALPMTLEAMEIEKYKEQFPFDFKYAPDAETILNQLVPEVYANSIQTAIFDAIAAEHGARMSAMENASTNSKEMIDSLTLKMNKLRQAAITTELIEVVSGAESLNG